MKSKITVRFEIKNFESLSENSESKFVGGFSHTISGGGNSSGTISNNCQGGNCTTDCGTGGPIGKNLQCNVAQFCGGVM